ncbi:hypothetical protein HHE02_01430 [Helicobacter heilmannii]|uniref:hypothetical protein n=2 Tax=Helicobacter heilmannii TaxID=35817 RepID=UPI0006A1A411|nr:hypothetical protein [Helicobacter heilmannii]BDQ28085.1 hypothetical protein ASB1_17610 [Helicobacter heilmannii]CRF46873.1 hypothetical protein HHE02_01430 [Helicobacter heilmannii]CRF50655.1 hypothetical protein HHE06_04960 [Helicobacter heilmannii]
MYQGPNLQLYQSVLHFFLDPAHALFTQIGQGILQNAPFRLFCNLCMVLALMLWALNRVRLADFFFLRTLFSLCAFALFFILFNYATNHPTAFYTRLKEGIFYAPNILTKLVQQSLQASSHAFNTDPTHFNLEFLLNQTFHSLVLLATQTQRHFNNLMVGFVYALIVVQGALLTCILALTLIVSLELLLWLALAVFVLPLGLFAPALLWCYAKKCFSLAFYQPLILLLSFYNTQILQTLIKSLLPAPTQATPPLIEAYLILIVSTLLALFLLVQIPVFLRGLFATQGGAQDLKAMLNSSKSAWLNYSQGVSNTPAPSLAPHHSHTHSSNSSPQESLKEPSFQVQTFSSTKMQIHQIKDKHEII